MSPLIKIHGRTPESYSRHPSHLQSVELLFERHSNYLSDGVGTPVDTYMDCVYIAFLSKAFTFLPHIHPFIHTFTHRRRCQPCKATASWSGAVKVRWCLAQGHLHTWDRTSNLPVASVCVLNCADGQGKVSSPQGRCGSP